MAFDAAGRSPGPGAADAQGRGGFVPALILFSGLSVVYGLTFPTTFMHVDAHAATVQAWHLGTTGSPWLEESLSDQPSLRSLFIGEAANGHVVAHRMAGPVLLGVPFYWFGSLMGLDAFSQVPGGIASAVAMALAGTFLFAALSGVVTRGAALVGSLAFALTTPSWTVAADQLWTHTVTQPAIAGAAFAASRSRWGLAGVALGLGMLGRPHVALIAAVLGFGVAASRRQLRPVIAVAAPTSASLLILALWNRWIFGSFSVEGPYIDRTESVVSGFQGSAEWSGSYPQVINFLGFMFAPDRGLFIWTPVLLLMVPALWRTWSTLPDWSKWLLVGGLLYTVAQLRLNYFVGGPTFWGYRHGLELLTCVAPAVVLSWTAVGRVVRVLVPPILGIQFSVMFMGAISVGYYVALDDVWVDNAALVFARAHPPVFTALVIAGAVGASALARWAPVRMGVHDGYSDRRSATHST